VVAEYINSNLHCGHIQQSTSSSGAPVLFTCKKIGNICLCVDFCGLNAITWKNWYPLPLINDLIDHVQGCKIFTIIDLKSAYFHLWIWGRQQMGDCFPNTSWTFRTSHCSLQPHQCSCCMQSFIQDDVHNLLNIICVVYLDNIPIFSCTQEEHDQHVALVLDCLHDTHLCANAAKCEFNCSKVKYLGFIISSDGVKMNPKKLNTISKWPELTKVKEPQSFLGFTNFYHCFINGYSWLTFLLTELTKKSSKWNLSLAAKSACTALKAQFFAMPLLQHFDSTVPCC
jgi:Reverse transcriptase (RNA-dependent DNA polymerase)